MTVIFDPQKIVAVNRYINLLSKPSLRRYGFAYVDWLRVGGVDELPNHPGVSIIGAKALRDTIDEFKLWEGARNV